MVHDPSVSTAFVNGIMEAKEWILNTDGTIVEAYNKFEDSISTLPKHSEAKEALLKEQILKFINALKNNNKKMA